MRELTCSRHSHSSVRYDGATDQAIDEFFRARDLACPTDYADFLRRYNGGCFSEGLLAKTPLGPLLVSYFSTLAPSPRRYIPAMMEHLEEYIPAGFVPVADDPGGNLYLLDCGCDSERNGKVYFWDHERASPAEDPVLDSFDNLTLLFSSFTAFIDAMKDKDSSVY
jgi:hypothetical protein